MPTAPTPPDTIIGRKQAARLLGVHPATVTRMLVRKQLEPNSRTPGGHARFKHGDILKLRTKLCLGE